MKLTEIAFVSLRTIDQAKYIIKTFKKNKIHDFLFRIWRFASLCFFYQLPFSKDTLEVQYAPEPTDIEWQNLGYNIATKMRRRFAIFCFMMCIVVIDFYTILQIDLKTNSMYFIPGNFYAEAHNQFLNFISANVIVTLDLLLEILCLQLN